MPLFGDVNDSPTRSLPLEGNDLTDDWINSGYCDYEYIEQAPIETGEAPADPLTVYEHIEQPLIEPGEAPVDPSSVHEHPQATTSTFVNGMIIISFLIDFLMRP